MYFEQQHVHKALAYIGSFHPICGTQYLTKLLIQVSCIDFLVFDPEVAHTITLYVEETEKRPLSSLSYNKSEARRQETEHLNI